VAEGFDAGVRLEDSVPQDMIAVRFGKGTRFVAVASPRYLKQHGAPRTPDDLHEACVHPLSHAKWTHLSMGDRQTYVP
jgi:DNA-binding transcriptional LysR family regulator